MADEFVKVSLVQATEYFIESYDRNRTVEDIVESINRLVHDFYYYEVVIKDGVKEFLN